jgi:Methyltransferase domain
MMLLGLCRFNCYETDKFIGPYSRAHSYVEQFYDAAFEPRRESTKRLLEIGVWKGGSLKLWADYFQNATIYGLDSKFVTPDLGYHPRVRQHLVDAYNHDFIETIPDGKFDIIIDDGPHTLVSQMVFLARYLPKVAAGGIAVIEDVLPDHARELECIPTPGWERKHILCPEGPQSRLLVLERTP